MSRVDERFESMGCEARIVLESAGHDAAALTRCADAARALIEHADDTLTRFDPASELCRLNRDPRPAVPASKLMQRFVGAARDAATASDGLVDATLIEPLERLGYEHSRTGLPRPPLAEIVAGGPQRRAARPRGDGRSRAFGVDQRGRVVRPPGLRLDSGGIGKGLAADLAAAELPPGIRYAICVGGDMAVGGPPPNWTVAVEDARGSGDAHRLVVVPGGVATSGIHARCWRRPGGALAHHLLDPATGEPAWTGLVTASAVAGSALDAEILAKSALLSGPRGARRLLRRLGGVLQHDDGRLEVVPPAPVVRLKVAA